MITIKDIDARRMLFDILVTDPKTRETHRARTALGNVPDEHRDAFMNGMQIFHPGANVWMRRA